tara:strand:- start:4652 stop:5911 length:1260 start_codon:yes stop_codon:yes gene_type:complete
MDQLIKRLELIKASIALGDIEVIEIQLPKLKELAMDEKSQEIVRNIQLKAWSDVVANIENFLDRHRGLVMYEDSEIHAFRFELKQLEGQIEQLHEQRNEMIYLVEQFQFRYQLELGEVIQNILSRRIEIKAFKKRQLEEAFEKANSEYAEVEYVLNTLKAKRKNIEERLNELDPFADGEEYESIESELDDIEANIKEQQNTVKQARTKTKFAKKAFEDSPEFKNYHEAEKEYDEFTRIHDEILQDERTKLTEEDEKELKLLFRKSARLCHPDLVTNDLKEQATEMMKQLNQARKQGDLSLVREIYESLKNGIAFVLASDKLNDKVQIQRRLEELRQVRQTVEIEIAEIEQSDTWVNLPDTKNWNDYFFDVKKQLKAELERLDNEMAQIKKSLSKDSDLNNISAEHYEQKPDDDFWNEPF